MSGNSGMKKQMETKVGEGHAYMSLSSNVSSASSSTQIVSAQGPIVEVEMAGPQPHMELATIPFANQPLLAPHK